MNSADLDTAYLTASVSAFATEPESFAANSGRHDSIYSFAHFPEAFAQPVSKMMELAAVQMMIAPAPAAGLLRKPFAPLNPSIKRTVRQWRESLLEVFSFYCDLVQN